jgi:hypothetical protein
MDPRELHERLDACRPGSDDLAQPELAAVRAELQRDAGLRRRANKSEQFDRAVAASMQDVTVPLGLKERLLASLIDPPAVAQETILTEPVAVNPRRRIQRRTIIAGLIAAAACVALVVMLPWNESAEPWGALQIADRAVAEFEKFDPALPDGWDAGKAPRSAFIPLDRNPQQRVVEVAGCKGVAYRVFSRQQVVGALLLLRPSESLKSFPTRPHAVPQVNTSGRVASCWAENKQVYVLVFKGNASDYKAFLKATGPVALRRILNSQL